jgi:hypothetical protein
MQTAMRKRAWKSFTKLIRQRPLGTIKAGWRTQTGQGSPVDLCLTVRRAGLLLRILNAVGEGMNRCRLIAGGVLAGRKPETKDRMMDVFRTGASILETVEFIHPSVAQPA